MLPLSMTGIGEKLMVNRVSGNEEVRQHLSDLGFVPGTEVQVIQAQDGNVIVRVRDSRLAITRSMAGRILGDPVAAESKEPVKEKDCMFGKSPLFARVVG